MKRSTVPTILGIIILVVGVAIGVFLLQGRQQFRLGASQSEQPKDVRISNITGSSFTVSWYTDEPTIGYLEWGDSTKLGKTTTSDSTTTQRIHSLSVENLEPSNAYYFEINSNGSKINNNGSPWQTKTGALLQPKTQSEFISGSVKLENGLDAQGVLVYVTAQGGQQLLATTSQKGEWIIPISDLRDASLNSYMTTTPQTLLNIYVQAATDGVASAQVNLGGANPTPPIIIGKVHDFRSQTATSETTISPSADITLPAQDVSIDSVKEGETIYTQLPEFFGTAPAGAEISIQIESEIENASITADKSGSWNWSPTQTLEEGIHKITLSWTDENGILQTITKSFTVLAAENEPSFESTPSVTISTPTPSPSPSPSPTPKPIVTPSPTPSPSPSPSPTPTPRLTVPSTSSAVPESGIGAPVIIISAFGIILVSFGVLLSL